MENSSCARWYAVVLKRSVVVDHYWFTEIEEKTLEELQSSRDVLGSRGLVWEVWTFGRLGEPFLVSYELVCNRQNETYPLAQWGYVNGSC